MSSTSIKPAFAVTPVAVIGAMLALVLGFAMLAHQTGLGVLRMPEAPVVEYRDLRFADRIDGSVVVSDAANGSIAAVLEPGTNGFIRGVMRGRARERRLDGAGSEPPFRLARHADGRLTLEDMATSIKVVLNSFGPSNAEAFARLLQKKGDGA